MPFCTYCGQSFTRDEHLERHILTHTNVKPYKCFNCHMSFARRDLLHRHYTVHGRDGNQEPLGAPNGMIPKSAGRTPIACSNCAKTKTKCDKKFPCSRCANRNLHCQVRPTRRTTKNTPSRPLDQTASSDSLPTIPPSNLVSAESSNTSEECSARTSAHNSPPSSPNRSDHEPSAPNVEHCASEGSQQRPGSRRREIALLPQTQPEIHSEPTPAPQGVMSPAPTPTSAFFQGTPLSGYEDFMKSSNSLEGEGENVSMGTQYMVDWSQMAMPVAYDTCLSSDMLASMPSNFGAGMDLSHYSDATTEAMGFVPGYFTAPPIHMQTSVSANELDGNVPTGGSETPDSAIQSLTSSRTADEAEAILSSYDAWSAFRCNPSVPSSACPKTARLNLMRLEEILREHQAWTTWKPYPDEADFPLGEHLSLVPFQEMSRDKLLAITQSFLHKALEIHHDDSRELSRALDESTGYSNFVILPPARVLEYFLCEYANSFERFYPLTARGTLDPNALMQCRTNDKASSLLLLLMIAQGALTTPTVDGRWLAGGLTETCRISLFDLIEKNIMLSGDPLVLHSALLFTIQAGWSGDKWQMDIAMGQRGMYFAMLRHSGFLELQQKSTPSLAPCSNIDMLWSEWIQQESRSRLVYSWVMVDQDLSLFHDTPPLFSVTEFGAPMPDSDALWHARTAVEWSSIFEQVHEFSSGYSSIGSGARPLCLRDLFRLFLDDAIVSQGIELTPLHLRLLLHPLQSLVCQFRQLLNCFSDTSGLRPGSKSFTAASTRVRLDEVQNMLQRWYGLADRYMKSNAICPLMQANLAMFHLISLNAVTNFPEIERMARRESTDGSYQQLVWFHRQCITDVEEAIFHAGQTLRLVRAMPRSVRPPWWAGAIYRVALLLWCDSLVHSSSMTANARDLPLSDSSFPVDGLPPDHKSVIRYLTKREGTPTLTKCDASQIGIDNPDAVLLLCVDVIYQGVPTRFSDGICSKLSRLAKGG